MRYVRDSMKVGPPPRRARSTASFVARYTATASLPSTRIPGKPYARALIAIVSDAVCRFAGTEIAHWLFWQTITTGGL